jgi:hypothetical protein
MIRSFLSKKATIEAPKIDSALLSELNIEDAESCQNCFRQHFNYWINGPLERRNDETGRWVCHALWQCHDNRDRLGILVDNLDAVKAHLDTLEDDGIDFQRLLYQYLRLSYLFGASQVGTWLQEKIQLKYADDRPITHEEVFALVAYSKNMKWLELLIQAHKLEKFPDSAYRYVSGDSYNELVQLAKTLFNEEPLQIQIT